MKEVEQVKEIYRHVFGSESGKRVLKDLEVRSNFRVSSYVQGDANGTAFEEGKRAVYLHILNMLEEANK